MRCNVCGCADFEPAEYVMDDEHRAPALDCLRCHALVLDEVAATSEEERESVRLAKAVRRQISESRIPLRREF